MNSIKVYFSDFFEVSPHLIEQYGALNISLINDLPLFVDPFLLFNSSKSEYKKLHGEMLKYLCFLRDQSLEKKEQMPRGLLSAWYSFPEIKQTWLGFSTKGNSGKGPGFDFAESLHASLSGPFQDFDNSTISHPHIEKFCLIKEGIGRDNISDFVTNLIHGFLLDYTQTFSQKYINPVFLKKRTVNHVSFNYDTHSWMSGTFLLPCLNDDYVLLTPRDILTKDQNWINKKDLALKFLDIAYSIPNEQLRSQLNNYFHSVLPTRKTKKGLPKENSLTEKMMAISETIRQYPILLDYYLKYKEDHGKEATTLANCHVEEIEDVFIYQLRKFIAYLQQHTSFYDIETNSKEATLKRIMYLKDCIEHKGCHSIFYHKKEPIGTENYLQIMFRLTWYNSRFDVNREVNNGRGPVDYKISYGSADMSLVEFKLASNSQLERNLSHQLEIYQRSNQVSDGKVTGFKVIIYFNDKQYERVRKILAKIGKTNDPNIILIDASLDNKISASKAGSH